MKYVSLFSLIGMLLFYYACNNNPKKLSKSYLEIKQYLSDAKIDNADNIYFYMDKPRMPLPNVFCFDSIGVQLSTPPGCFSIIQRYIEYLGDSIPPIRQGAENLEKFLDSIHIMDAYDKQISISDVQDKSDFYLFIDYITMPDPEFQKILFDAVNSAQNSKKRIKLFLVHAFSEKNIKTLQKKPDSVNKQAIQEALLK